LIFKDKIELIHNCWKREGSPELLSGDWKNSLCKLFDVALVSVNTLDPLFQVATLPDETFKLVLDIVSLYSKGNLKNQKSIKKDSKRKDIGQNKFQALQGK
jgi:hypothetical protein